MQNLADIKSFFGYQDYYSCEGLDKNFVEVLDDFLLKKIEQKNIKYGDWIKIIEYLEYSKVILDANQTWLGDLSVKQFDKDLRKWKKSI